MTFAVVYVEWIDSESDNEWTPLAEVTGTALTLTHSVGLLVHDSADLIVLALSYDSGTESINGFMTIPRSAVRKMRTLCRLAMS